MQSGHTTYSDQPWAVDPSSGALRASNRSTPFESTSDLVMIWLLRTSASFLILITLLPLVPLGYWFIRWWDFPRLQICFLTAIPIIAAIVLMWRTGWESEPIFWLVGTVSVLIWQAGHILPFSPVWTPEVRDANAKDKTARILVANLDYQNVDSADAVVDELKETDTDILLLIEINEPWFEKLKPLHEYFPHRHDELHGEGLGISLWSKFPLKNPESKYLVSDRRASIWAEIQLEGHKNFNFVGVHPTPPGLKDSTGEDRRNSRVRDAELILVAKEIADRQEESWVVAGDFNDVAWSHTTRLFKRISGLRDPRVGRSFMGTYIAQYPPLRCPIDHVFVSDGFSISDLSRTRLTGSDHFGVIADISLRQPDAGVTPRPQGNDREDAENLVEEGAEDAKERDVAAKPVDDPDRTDATSDGNQRESESDQRQE